MSGDAAAVVKMKPEDWGFLPWLDEKQAEALVEFEQLVREERIPGFPRKWLKKEHLLRYLRARNFRPAKALIQLREDVEFKNQYEWALKTQSPTSFPLFYDWHCNGLVRFYGYDREKRPVIILKQAHLWPSKITDKDEITRVFLYYAERLVRLCEENGFVDYSAIASFEGFDPFRNFSLPLTRQIIELLQGRYPERLRYCWLIHLPFGFERGWKMITPFLDERVKAKMLVIGSKLDKLHTHIAPDQIDVAHGGTRIEEPEFPDFIMKPGGTVRPDMDGEELIHDWDRESEAPPPAAAAATNVSSDAPQPPTSAAVPVAHTPASPPSTILKAKPETPKRKSKLRIALPKMLRRKSSSASQSAFDLNADADGSQALSTDVQSPLLTAMPENEEVETNPAAEQPRPRSTRRSSARASTARPEDSGDSPADVDKDSWTDRIVGSLSARPRVAAAVAAGAVFVGGVATFMASIGFA